jgi:hypothetical protein
VPFVNLRCISTSCGFSSFLSRRVALVCANDSVLTSCPPRQFSLSCPHSPQARGLTSAEFGMFNRVHALSFGLGLLRPHPLPQPRTLTAARTASRAPGTTSRATWTPTAPSDSPHARTRSRRHPSLLTTVENQSSRFWPSFGPSSTVPTGQVPAIVVSSNPQHPRTLRVCCAPSSRPGGSSVFVGIDCLR